MSVQPALSHAVGKGLSVCWRLHLNIADGLEQVLIKSHIYVGWDSLGMDPHQLHKMLGFGHSDKASNAR